MRLFIGAIEGYASFCEWKTCASCSVFELPGGGVEYGFNYLVVNRE